MKKRQGVLLDTVSMSYERGYQAILIHMAQSTDDIRCHLAKAEADPRL